MKYCFNCDAEIRPKDKYCRNCGAIIKSDAYYVIINIATIIVTIFIVLMIIMFIASYFSY
jgi:predicted amidophosphoribosyltransferase